MMMMKKKLLVAALVAAVVALAVMVERTEAVSCSATELSSCAPAILYGTPPSGQCCGKLSQQKPCLCGYLKNPSLRQYVSSPNAKKVASTCRVPLPSC